MLRRLAPAYRAVVSFGIAGGLDVVLSPGDAVLARGIIAGTTRWVAHPGLTQDWVQRLIAGGQNVVVAEIVGVDVPVLTAAAKAALRAATDAAAVDMESHVAAEFAAANGIPFAALRIVCDSATHSLPPFVCDALGANGVLGWRRVLGMLMRRPLQILSLPRLAWDTAAAFTGLRRCRALLGPDLGNPGLAQPFSDVS
nr:phosphorylase [Microvirga puerhi]